MKKLQYIVLLTVALLVSNCDTNDDGFYNNVFAEVPNLVAIDAHASTYTVGEKLYISADFSRYLAEGSTTLDAFETTGANQFAFSYVIEKQTSATTWDVVNVNDSQLDIVKGSAQNGSYVYGICQYNTADETYEYRVGFPLLSTGTYRLSFNYNSDTPNKVELRSLSPKKRLILNINSVITGLDSAGFYHFTVN
ncbi:MAG TPA: hypothetical protein PKN96_07780 [Flavobacterium sp.]|uniref:hypothetical protein n=1 Tax=Flavobacterium sp. TaxID=239 RepID=UPI002BCCB936|nr:hypothetical protein [Flavobacterium sp.]HNP33177.1 hypothetical protein [Flavobacterium sp.]